MNSLSSFYVNTTSKDRLIKLSDLIWSITSTYLNLISYLIVWKPLSNIPPTVVLISLISNVISSELKNADNEWCALIFYFVSDYTEEMWVSFRV